MSRAAFLLSFALLVCVVGLTEFLCPFTKVEESFNMQAMHDFFFAANTDVFDHHLFPGVVPRTFIGAWLVSFLTLTPLAFVVEPLLSTSRTSDWTGAHAKELSHACRGVLGGMVLWSLWSLATALATTPLSTRRPSSTKESDQTKTRDTDEPDATRTMAPVDQRAPSWLAPVFFCLLCASQFHLVFYATRALPNTFGLVLCTLAAAQTLRGRGRAGIALLSIAAALFRCDVLALLAPHGLYVTVTAAAAQPMSGAHRFLIRCLWWLFIGAMVGLASVVVSVSGTALGLDSFLWRRWLWPEGVVLLFNTAENKSGEWGRSPVHWYWSRALPRALLCAYPVLLWLVAVRVWDAWTSFFTSPGRVDTPSITTPTTTTTTTTQASFVAFFLRTTRRVERQYRCVLLPALVFIALYSALPHKELRFILVVFPWLLAPVAVWLAELWAWTPTTNTCPRASRPLPRTWWAGCQTVLHTLTRASILVGLVLAFSSCAVSVVVSAANYPGGTALRRLEAIIASDVQAHAHQSLPPAAPVTVFIDAYAAMAGVNRFQKTFFQGHVPLFPRETSAEQGEVVETSSLRTRWRALTMLPIEALLWRAQACLGPVQAAPRLAVETVRDVLRKTPAATTPHGELAAGNATGQCVYNFATVPAPSSPSFSSSSTSSSTSSLAHRRYVRYVKDPTLFLTAEEVRAIAVAARTGRAGPTSSQTTRAGESGTEASEASSSAAVYQSDGIDYALVRASQWELHLVDHDVFELLFVQRDETKTVLSDLKWAVKACVQSRQVGTCARVGKEAVTHVTNTMQRSLGMDVSDDVPLAGREQAARPVMARQTDTVRAEEKAAAYLLALRRRRT